MIVMVLYNFPLKNTLVYLELCKLLTQLTDKQKFGVINGVDNVNWPPYRDSES